MSNEKDKKEQGTEKKKPSFGDIITKISKVKPPKEEEEKNKKKK